MVYASLLGVALHQILKNRFSEIWSHQLDIYDPRRGAVLPDAVSPDEVEWLIAHLREEEVVGICILSPGLGSLRSLLCLSIFDTCRWTLQHIRLYRYTWFFGT